LPVERLLNSKSLGGNRVILAVIRQHTPSMTHEGKPHPLNVPGDFYVEDGCCTLCDVPRTEAPDLFAITPTEDHCFVKRQPRTNDETNRMLSAIACAEVQCIHYRGNDPAIISRLSAMGEMDICDTTPPPGTEIGLRTHLTFLAPERHDLASLCSSFKTFLKTQRGKYSRMVLPWRSTATTARYKRNDKGWRNVVFERHKDRVHALHDGHDDTSVSWYLARWLETLNGVTDIRWYTDSGWSTTGVWHPSHY
jgi:hypothetical protein